MKNQLSIAKKALLLSHENWDVSHEMIQDYSEKIFCQVHAYLHRLEGDRANASYWYGRAGEKFPNNTEQQEYERLMNLVNS